MQRSTRSYRRARTGRAGALVMCLVAAPLVVGLGPQAEARKRKPPIRVQSEPGCGSPGEKVKLRPMNNSTFPDEGRVTVGGKKARVLKRKRRALTIRLPALPAGVHQVRSSGRPRIVSGAVVIPCELAGLDTDPAAAAIQSITPMPAAPTDIVNGIILSRLSVYLAPGATVGAVNDAIEAIGGKIIGSLQGLAMLSVQVPRQPDVDALQALADQLAASDAIAAAVPAAVPALDNAPANPGASLAALKRTRFPGAWNALELAERDCEAHRVPVLVPDHYSRPAPSLVSGFSSEIPQARVTELGIRQTLDRGDHGYRVMGTLAANFDLPLLGAAPLPQCLDLIALNVGGLSTADVSAAIAQALPTEEFIVNTSLGFPNICQRPDGSRACEPPTVIHQPLQLLAALDTLTWKSIGSADGERFLHATAAGNDGNQPEGAIYSGDSLAEFGSMFAAAAMTDPTLDRFSDTELWTPIDGVHPEIPVMALTPEQQQEVAAVRDGLGLGSVSPLSNTVVVGSISSSGSESGLSNRGPHLRVVAENVPALGGAGEGTSLAAPQVAGLAAYLWLLSDELRQLPASATADLIKASIDPENPLELDALAAVLALDEATSDPTPANSPVRLAMLDIDNDRDFDEDDLTQFRGAYYDENGDPRNGIEDSSRFDLNGDGHRSITRAQYFDLDTNTSTQFGAPIYQVDITKDIDGSETHFQEEFVTDIEVVCYYAWSNLFTGDTFDRQELIGAPCAKANVTIVPDNPTVQTNGTIQLVAAVNNAEDETVTWTASAGSITGQGLFTAPSTPGPVTVEALSFEDPTVHDDVTVNVTGVVGAIELLSRSSHAVISGGGTFFNGDSFIQHAPGEGQNFTATGAFDYNLQDQLTTGDCQGVSASAGGTSDVHVEDGAIVVSGNGNNFAQAVYVQSKCHSSADSSVSTGVVFRVTGAPVPFTCSVSRNNTQASLTVSGQSGTSRFIDCTVGGGTTTTLEPGQYGIGYGGRAGASGNGFTQSGGSTTTTFTVSARVG